MAEPKENVLMEKIVSLCKRRGFVFQSSEIYGGIQGFWDYGPLGAELKRNVKDLWWRSMVHQRDDVAGLEATIIMAPQIWRASGHVDTFSDPMCDCLLTKKRFRADQVDELSGTAYHYTGAKDTVSGKESNEPYSVLLAPGKPPESARKTATLFYQQRSLQNIELLGENTEKLEKTTRYNPENGGLLTPPVPFNLMFKTYVGPTATDADVAYLRPETAQAIFAQFKNVLETSRQQVPFGIAQVGKAFRNEVTPRNFTFRSREFEQMELEFFIKPDEAIEAIHGSVAKPTGPGHPGEPQPNWGWQIWHQYWVEERVRFYEGIGLSRETLGFHIQTPEELAHYARATTDILFKFPFSKVDEKGEMKGEELEGVAARGDFDLTQHENHSGKSTGVFDEALRAAWPKVSDETKARMRGDFVAYKTQVCIEKKKMTPEDAAAAAEAEAKVFFEKLAKGQYIPHVIEPSAGVDRLILGLITNAYSEVTSTDEKGKSETRVIMKFHPRVAPYKVGVFPLLKNKPELVAKAKEVFNLLRPHALAFYDEAGAIGRRYARQDEAGTPFCVTIDFDTLGEKPELLNTVTVRHRDDGKQERMPISELLGWLLPKVR